MKDGLNFSHNGEGDAYLFQSVAIHFNQWRRYKAPKMCCCRFQPYSMYKIHRTRFKMAKSDRIKSHPPKWRVWAFIYCDWLDLWYCNFIGGWPLTSTTQYQTDLSSSYFLSRYKHMKISWINSHASYYIKLSSFKTHYCEIGYIIFAKMSHI